MVIPSAQVGFEGTYSHILFYKLLLYGFEVVLVILRKVDMISHYLALFALSAK